MGRVSVVVRHESVPFFELEPMRALLSQEWEIVREGSSRTPSGAALSLAPSPAIQEKAIRSHPAMIRLHLSEGCLQGDLRCQPGTLPIDSDSIQLLVARHVLDLLDLDSGIEEELGRVLAPGGSMFLFGMNGLSPWRLWSALHASGAGSSPRARSLVRVRRKFVEASLHPVRYGFLGGSWPRMASEAGIDRGNRLHGAWALLLTKQRSAGRLIPLRSRGNSLSLGHGLAEMPSRRACL